MVRPYCSVGGAEGNPSIELPDGHGISRTAFLSEKLLDHAGDRSPSWVQELTLALWEKLNRAQGPLNEKERNDA